MSSREAFSSPHLRPCPLRRPRGSVSSLPYVESSSTLRSYTPCAFVYLGVPPPFGCKGCEIRNVDFVHVCVSSGTCSVRLVLSQHVWKEQETLMQNPMKALQERD